MKGLSQELEARHTDNRVAYAEAHKVYGSTMKQMALDRIEKYSLLIDQHKGQRIEGIFQSGLKQAEKLRDMANFILNRR